MNTSQLNQKEIHQLLSEILGYQLDNSCSFLLPFYSDYGRNIKIGREVKVSCNVTMADKGGIKIGDRVAIGSGASLQTVDGRVSGPIVIDADAYIGANALILPNVHIGASACVGAGTVVTHNVPAGKTVTAVSKGVI